MGQPKAKWSKYGVNEWSAEVGPLWLQVQPSTGRIEIWTTSPSGLIWSTKEPTPCDVTDLMRLAEAELARRLHGAADTMNGRELVAEPEHATVVDPGRDEGTVWMLHDGSGVPKPLCYVLAPIASTCLHCGGSPEEHTFDCPISLVPRCSRLGCVQPRCDKHFRPDLCIEHALQDERENFSLRYATVEFEQTCYLCGRAKVTTQKLHEEHVLSCRSLKDLCERSGLLGRRCEPQQERLTIGTAAAYDLRAAAERELANAIGNPRIAMTAVLDQAKRDNPLMVSEQCFCRGQAKYCALCDTTGRVERRATPEEEREHEAKQQPAVGSREWAIEQMAQGHFLQTSNRYRYGRDGRSDGWVRFPLLTLEDPIVVYKADLLPRDGWYKART